MNTEETKELRGVELLRAIKQHILEEPKRINMSHWLLTGYDSMRHLQEFERPACNTVGCIAGWACFLTGNTEASACDVPEEGRRLLGLTNQAADKLFYISGWPDDLTLRYCQSSNQSEYHCVRAQVTAEAIDWFIANYMMAPVGS